MSEKKPTTPFCARRVFGLLNLLINASDTTSDGLIVRKGF